MLFFYRLGPKLKRGQHFRPSTCNSDARGCVILIVSPVTVTATAGTVTTVAVLTVSVTVGLIARGCSWTAARRTTAAGRTTPETARGAAPTRYLQRIPKTLTLNW